MQLDLVVRDCRVVTAREEFRADIAIAGGCIAALGELPADAGAREEIDAGGRIVTPGGVDPHCHIDEPADGSARLTDGFATASRSAACGGTTTIVPFLNQEPDRTLQESLRDYLALARPSVIDYAFHVILASAAPEVLRDQLPPLLAGGIRAVKVFMTYPGYMMDDTAMLDVMAAVAAADGLLMVHAENGSAAQWIGERMAREGRTGLSHFAEAFPAVIEAEAVHRAISLSRITDTRLMIVHVSGDAALEEVRRARRQGDAVLAETCPQYLVGIGDRLAAGGDDWETAKDICSPPPRRSSEAAGLWPALAEGVLDLVSSDHCPYSFEAPEGKRVGAQPGQRPDYRAVPPGLPGLETRLPVLFEEGVVKGRISLSRFVELTATRPAQIYGLWPRKGSLMPGADADLVIWDTGLDRTIRNADLHHGCDYTPFEGMRVSAWPAVTLSRGERVWDGGAVVGKPGRGRYLGSAQ